MAPGAATGVATVSTPGVAAGGPAAGVSAGVVAAGVGPGAASGLGAADPAANGRRPPPAPGLPPRLPRVLRVLVAGAGPAGLRAAMAAAERGHAVTLVEQLPEIGGQVAVAARAPGRAGFGVVVHDLLARCRELGVAIRTGVTVDPSFVADAAPDAVVVATGSRPVVPDWADADVAGVLAGEIAPSGTVLVVDELGFHPATSAAELLTAGGCAVEIVTPGMVVGQDLGLTLDLPGFHRRAHDAGIRLATDRLVVEREGPTVRLLHHPTGRTEDRRCDAVVSALPRRADDGLWRALRGGPAPVVRIGDCVAPRRADAAIREGDACVAALEATVAVRMGR